MKNSKLAGTSAAISRRTVIQGIGAASLVSLTACGQQTQNKSDVIVIGAGLSGLGAALLLQDAGVNVQVIEGRNRIGGRVESFRNIPGDPEAGGTAFAPGYARLVDQAVSHGVELIDITPTVPFFFNRQLVLNDEFISKEAWASHPGNPFQGPAKKMMPWMYLPMLAARTNPLKTAEDWQSPENAKLDVSLHEYLRSIGQTDEMIDIAYNMHPTWGNSSHHISALQPLHAYFFSGMQRRLTADNPIKGYTAKGGNQAIPEAMANALKNEVILNQKVTGIRSNSTDTEVHCDDGTVYRAKRVICSVPCSVLKDIRIEPMVEGAQAKAIQTLESQVVNQVHIVPKKPFWEEDGMSANMFTNSKCGMVVAEHKGDSPEDITSLTAWVRGPNALWMDQVDNETAINAVVSDLERLRPAAKGQLEVLAYKSWYHDPFSVGDWAVWQPGQVTSLAPHVGKPHERIHFCGEHTAVSNRGMEGALESGDRVAFEVLNSL